MPSRPRASVAAHSRLSSANAVAVELDQTPDLLGLHRLRPERYPFLLDSAGGTGGAARFDILLAFPGPSLTLAADGRLTGPGAAAGSFLAALDGWWSEESVRRDFSDGLPFKGGWFIFLAYEFASQIEPRLMLQTDPLWPLAVATRIPAAVIIDRQLGKSFALTEADRSELQVVISQDLRHLSSQPATSASNSLIQPDSLNEDDPRCFLAAAEKAMRYIAAGDIYQANLSRRWQAEIAAGVTPWMIYESLRRSNPGPFAGLALIDGSAIMSSSPERLVRVRGWRVETRPIAGTRPRSREVVPDQANRSELIANAKERAEHVMLIDLERNDLGRICRAGSVHVDEFMTVESYAHVHHIVSNVTGELRAQIRPGAVLQAVFPGGTITGCPKVRCMSIIHELEQRPRGPYCGAMGYLNRDGSCDLNILIRTMALSGRKLRLDAGSGIVADSVPEKELSETRAKAKGMLLSLQRTSSASLAD